MFSIGEFASIGRVSVRMLSHYDEIGLLTPARVDPFSGYRSYEGAQFTVLGSVLAFKDLGFRLDEVARIVHGDIDGDALHEMLAARRAELAQQLDLDAARLQRLDARIRHIEGEPLMPNIRAMAAARRLAGTRSAATTAPMPKKAPWHRAAMTRPNKRMEYPGAIAQARLPTMKSTISPSSTFFRS